MIITGKTSSGFDFAVEDGFADDFNFVRAYKKAKSKSAETQIEGICDMITCVFADEEQEERFYAHIAGIHGGRVPSKVLWGEVEEIVTALKESPDSKN